MGGCGGGNTGPQSGRTAPGAPESAKSRALESAASLIQSKGPVSKISLYLDGFHASKDDPRMQMETHHYSKQVNEDFAQCVLFDGNNTKTHQKKNKKNKTTKQNNTQPTKEKADW